MRITKVKPFPLSADRPYMFVKVETDEGIYGIGEAGITWREWAIEGAVRHLEPVLVGQNPFRTEYLWQKMARIGFFPADKIVCAAMSAIDIALWDVKGKALKQPLYNLLGGLCRDKVVCYPHNRGDSLAQLLDSMKKTTAEGWKFARWGLAPPEGNVLEPAAAVRKAVTEFEAVRKTLGPEVELCFDVHTRLDTADAIRLCRDVEQFKPFFIEDPLRSENEHSYETLSRHASVPIAAGEQWATKWPFRAVIENEWIQYARIDVCIVGGITEAMKVARWCEAHYIKLALHNPLGPVSTAACLQIDLASDNVGVQECPRVPGGYMQDLFPVYVPFEKGYLLPPGGYGLGIEFDESAAKKYPYKPGQAPELRRLDGAFTNW